MSKVTVRRATRADIEAFSDLANKPTIRAYVGVLDGEIIAIGGLAFSMGRWFAFCDLTEKARKYKLTIARVGKRIMDDAREMGLRFVYADADPNEPTAVRWLTSLGFEPDPRTLVYYRWRA
jgi:N-acetylglutamate synthase-like GNAT family acetyltransferase